MVNTIGILGGGQLGLMLARAANNLGYSAVCWDPLEDACAGRAATLITAPYDHPRALEVFTRDVDIATYEFENIPIQVVDKVDNVVPVFPSIYTLSLAQDRVEEKLLFKKLGIPTPEFFPVETQEDLHKACCKLVAPIYLKTRRGGYDGKGQQLIRDTDDFYRAWAALGGQPLIAEKAIPFVNEWSVIGARSLGGETAFYPLVQNFHYRGILHYSTVNCAEHNFQRAAQDYARRIMTELNYIGVLVLEFFEHQDQLLINEMAPRVHNSGHWTIEGSETSQFENHINAILGLPLGSRVSRRALMFNLIGVIPPGLRELANDSEIFIHIYGKQSRPGRKLGHVTYLLREDEDYQTVVNHWAKICQPVLA
jgi:5-(carboxyamino)imidazole ribonucleotide synthase